MNKDFYLVSDILNEGLGGKIAGGLGRRAGKIARFVGLTPEKFARHQRGMAKKLSKLTNQNISWKAPDKFSRGFESGLKTEPLTKSGNI